jgi:hypothetical protein
MTLLVWLSRSYKKISQSAMKPQSIRVEKFRAAQAGSAILILVAFLAADFSFCTTAAASNHYTEKQLAALADRVGKTFWIQEVNGRTPTFLAAAHAGTATFRARAGDSFEIVELVGRKDRNPYYKARFASGKEGYLRPEVILEELNLTLLTVDPLADQKRKAAKQAEEEKKRVDWINAQPWTAAVKEAALRGEPVPGMNFNEVKKIAGAPSRVTKLQPRGTTPEEHWFYPDGKQLIFQQGLLTRIVLDRSGTP